MTAAEAAKQLGDEERSYIGSAFKIAVDFVHARGKTSAVKARVSPETAKLLDKPPFVFSWMSPKAMDELQTAIVAVEGREACVELGLTAGRKLGGSMIAPVLRMATSLFGNTPATVFENLERFYSMVLKGMKFAYESTGPKGGVVLVTATGPDVPAALFDVTRGNLSYVFELCGVAGTVEQPDRLRIDERGGEARYKVRWG